jgi:hypothetical protein
LVLKAAQMTLRAALLCVLCVLAAGCAGVQPGPPDSAVLRPGQFGSGDPDVNAANLAEEAFADRNRTYGKPIEAARAAAAIDYLAGHIPSEARWAGVSGETKEQLLQGRAEAREAIGVAAAATSQAVVDHLTAAADALERGGEAAAMRQLGPPTFSGSGEETLARLAKLPYLRMANVSTARVANEMAEPNGAEDFPRPPLPSTREGNAPITP